MIKLKLIRHGNSPLFLIGLSDANIERLRAGNPIHFRMSEIGAGEGECLIVSGKDEGAIMADLETAGVVPPGSAEQARKATAKPPRRH